MNRGEWNDLFTWAWNDVWPNHLGETLDSQPRVTEALALAAEFYERHRARGINHENAKHRTFEDIMRTAGRLPPVATTALARLVGYLRIENGSFSDDTGPRLVTMCHAGDLAMRSSYDWDGAMRALDAIRAAGYHGIRVWDRLRWGGKPGEKPGIYGDWGHETATGWGPQLRRFIEACRDRDLCLHLAAGDLAKLSRDGRAAYFEAREELTRYFPSLIVLNEWANESRDTAVGLTPVQAQADIGPLRNYGLTALTAYTGHEDAALFRQWTPSYQEFCLVHGYRDGHWWDKLRHIFSLPYEVKTRRLWWHGEPFGVGNLVSASQNKHELTSAVMGMAAAQCFITGGAWTFFSSPGIVLGDERFEDQPGFFSTPKVAAALEAVGREFGLNWGGPRLTHGEPNEKKQNETLNAPYMMTAGGENARFDQAVDDSRGVVVGTIYGDREIAWRNRWIIREQRIIDPETGEVAIGDTRTSTAKPLIVVGIRA